MPITLEFTLSRVWFDNDIEDFGYIKLTNVSTYDTDASDDIITSNTTWVQDIISSVYLWGLGFLSDSNTTGWDKDSSNDITITSLDNNSIIRNHNTSWYNHKL